MSVGIDDGALTILQNPVFTLPRRRANPGVPIADFLADTFRGFLDVITEFDGEIADALGHRRRAIRTLMAGIGNALDASLAGRDDEALGELDTGLAGVSSDLESMSRRHTEQVLPSLSWYRLAAWPGVNRREHMFHVPFGSPQHAYRFSTPGAPTLYLARSVYLCWLECGQPPLADCYVSRFEVDTHGFDLLDLPCAHSAYLEPLESARALLGILDIDPRAVMNSPYSRDVVAELVEYLTVWPLLAAASVPRRPGETPAVEYRLPQLLMRWVRASDSFMGIRYFTSRDLETTNSNDWPINLALPARTSKDSGYCEFLASRVRLGEPQPLARMEDVTLEELVTPEAMTRREQLSGPVMLARGNVIEPYFQTAFGKMEYWLDRPSQTMDTIAPDDASQS